MPIIYTGKKRLEETPKEQKKKVKVPTPEEIQARIQEGIQAQMPSPADKVGAGSSALAAAAAGRQMPGQAVTTGQLKPEFQATENLARQAEGLGVLPESERIAPEQKGPIISPVLPGLSLVAQELAEEPINPVNALFAAAQGFLRGIPIKIKKAGGINLKDDTTIPESNDLLVSSIQLFKANPSDENFVNAMNTIQRAEQGLINQRGSAKITAKAEQLITGEFSNYEYELEQQIRKVNEYRTILANILRGANVARIQSQTRRQLTAGAEQQAGLAA